ncbi:MAG: AAA-like domain-containing protein [Nostocaceae cyanobacterium]|nr:AAA-like domain-containing protein [Nostocaceae cyanobacterium]
MTVPLESSIVRIYSNNGKVVGAGFLVSQKRILTCAHVMCDAFVLSRETTQMPDGEVSLDFPLLTAKQLFKARVVFWRPVSPDEFAEDIAGLELESLPPAGAKPTLLMTYENFWGNPFRVLGFPAKQPNGAWASGELRAAIGNGWVQLEDVKEQGYALEPGFSGAPIWDEVLQGVAGMAVAADKNRPNAKAAFMIPSKVLCAAWTDLGEQEISTPVTEELPEGQVDLASPFYVERPPIESDCYRTITQPGALIRVKAPRQMGKTSLMARILAQGELQGYQKVPVYFEQADRDVFANLDQFLQWFCSIIAYELNLPDKLGDFWKGVLGSKNKCTNYFQRYLLQQISSPLVLGLDEVDLIFQYQNIATDFFGLLRAWHERAKNDAIWKKLRLVIVHSKEVYIPLNMNQSPFNVGLAIELPELNQAQVQDLVRRHGLNWHGEQIEELMAMVGGHPYLVRVALYQIARGAMTLEQLLQIAPTEEGLYCEHLRRHLLNLEENSELLEAMRQIVAAKSPVRIDTGKAFKLRSMGLVKMKGNDVLPLCDLYRQYFCDRLRVN